jgi:HAMP domain-containing protein
MIEGQTLRPVAHHSLRARVLVLVLVAFAAVALPAVFFFLSIVSSTTMRLGAMYAEKQVLYDRSRGLEALYRESALAETLARSPSLIEWASDETDPEKAARGLAELEHFRLTFRDRSYFFAAGGSGNYYFNDSADTYSGRQLRYTLDPQNPRDAWFYKTSAFGSGCHLNVDNDRGTGVTNVWFNCVVAQNGTTLGIVGTGIDLTTFIHEVVNTRQTGVETMFVDAGGAVQAVRDTGAIDYRSLSKAAEDRKTVFHMFESAADRSELAAMMVRVSRGEPSAETRPFSLDGRTILVGVGYLDRLGWYNVTFTDVDAIIDRSLFLPMGLLIAGMMVGAAALITLLFRRHVLNRLERAEQSLRRIENGNYDTPTPDGGQDEIGRLSAALTRMALALRDHTETLEEAVRERTDQLSRIASIDAMTGIANRRGLTGSYEDHMAASGGETAILLLDIDSFKQINDTHGHRAGDAVICEVARRIEGATAGADICARWGGDELSRRPARSCRCGRLPPCAHARARLRFSGKIMSITGAILPRREKRPGLGFQFGKRSRP